MKKIEYFESKESAKDFENCIGALTNYLITGRGENDGGFYVEYISLGIPPLILG